MRGLRPVVALMFVALSAHGAEIARGDLPIRGLSLEVSVAPVVTATDIATYVQTIFGGKTNDDAAIAPDLVAKGELSGPGIDTAITLVTQPGRKFQLPPLHERGAYVLQNIRLVDSAGRFVQQAIPSFAAVTVTDVFGTKIKVRQLSPDELRARGINVDSRNFDVFDITIVVAIRDGETVEVPYPIIVNKGTHEIIAAPGATEQKLPLPTAPGPPPRFQPPDVIPVALAEDIDASSPSTPSGSAERLPNRPHPTIPAAIVLPAGFGVLHQFFSIVLNVSNGAPTGTSIILDSITASMQAPLAMRVAKVSPAVAVGQPVPIKDKATGKASLIAGAEGTADWSLEALRAGTHTIEITIRATYRSPNQPDIPLKAVAQASIAVADPRFQFNFVHPDNVRAGENYTAYAFITNTSPSDQTIVLDTHEVPSCAERRFSNHICRVDGEATPQITIGAGATKSIAYKLQTDITGHAFAGVASAAAPIETSIQLTMGVSDHGIPLSPATLVLPYYARYLSAPLVDAHLSYFGLGYSLSIAPLNQTTAALPRIFRSDIFQRAQDLARAGQRIFVSRRDPSTDDPAEDRDAVFHLSLDLLGNVERVDRLANAADSSELDRLRRMEGTARRASASIAREIERVGLAGGKTVSQLVDDFAASTSYRSSYAVAVVHGAAVSGSSRPYAVSVIGATTRGQMDVPSEAASGWLRTLPYGELTQLQAAAEVGEAAWVGRWKESLELSVTAAGPSFTVDLIYPDAADGSFLRASLPITGADPRTPVKIVVARGVAPVVSGAQVAGSLNATAVAAAPLRTIAAAQDLHLDPDGHVVSLLLNRPLTSVDPHGFALTTRVPSAPYEQTRRDVIPGVALQDDGRIVNISFDHSLSTNANYVIGVDTPQGTIVPRIDNAAPGGIVFGKVLRGDGTAVGNAPVQILSNGSVQYDTTLVDGSFIFEHVPRDLSRNILGNYRVEATAEGKFARVEGVVRTVADVQRIVLQFLGRGTAGGAVRYSDGSVVAKATVTGGSTIYSEFHQTTTDASGRYTLLDLPVGPLTFAANDASGNLAYAATQIRTPGESIVQDLTIQKRAVGAGFATVRVTVKRSDTSALVSGAHVGVYTQGYGLIDGFTDGTGYFEFKKVPAGLLSVLASEFSLTRESAGVDLDLRADSVVDVPLTLHVPAASDAAPATLHGFVFRDDPLAPGDRSRDASVANAIVTIRGLPPIVANAVGEFTYAAVPVALSEKKILSVFDPGSARQGAFSLPQLTAGTTAETRLFLVSGAARGKATLNVRVVSAAGVAVSDYNVMSPGFPPDTFDRKGNGTYEKIVDVPQALDVWAVPTGHHAVYGDQVAHGTIRADFDGQTSVIELRLPGQGTALAKILVRKPCPAGQTTCAEEYDLAQGTVALTARVWNDDEQQLVSYTRNIDANATTSIATVSQIPAGENVLLETVTHPAGYAGERVVVAFDGDTRQVDLKLSSLGDVTGRVLAFDRQTPVAGAVVRFAGSIANLGPVTTGSDGSFRFAGVAANQTFRITADVTQDGVFRTGYVDGSTPRGGGPVPGLGIMMRQQAKVAGAIVDALGAPVPLARYWARELAWPNRSFGTASDPLIAGIDGKFDLNNIFEGPFRISASSPVRQEDRGDFQTDIRFENDNKTGVVIAVGSGGTGSVSVTVVDSNSNFKRVPFAEVTLVRGTGAFDFSTTDQNGLTFFENVPAGGADFLVRVTSKSAGRSGTSAAFRIVQGAVAQMQVVLDLLGRVAGTVVDGDVTPSPLVPGAPVFMSGSLNSISSTNGSGAFEFNGVPEGNFHLEALHIESGRRGTLTPDLFVSKLFPERSGLKIELERTATLNVKVYLPDDRGNAGPLAPLVDVKVLQTSYAREQQGNDLNFARMFARSGYHIEARELGGEERIATADGTFPSNTYANNALLIFKTSGTVKVHVTASDPALVTGARVQVNAASRSFTVFTDAAGDVTVVGVPLEPVTVQVTSSNLSAFAAGNLQSRSVPLVFNVALASRATIEGDVDAETGGPSIGTRVVLDVQSPALIGVPQLQTRTSSTGHYSFAGIPASSTRITLTMVGPDEITIGGTIVQTLQDGATGTVTMSRVRLDATPPRVLTIEPANNANSVSPNATMFVSFSEGLSADSLSPANFVVTATDDNSSAPIALTPEIANGIYRVRITPVGLLKSNVVYRIAVGQGVKDLAGHPLAAPVGSSFTTVNYTEPRIIRVDPLPELPLGDGATFRLKFNKPVDAASGVVKLEQLDASHGQRIADVPVSVYLDTIDASTIVVAPTGVAIQPSSFYRVTASAVRDTQTPPNIQKNAQSFDFFSFDHVKPIAAIVSPVPATFSLVANVAYTAGVKITDDGTTLSKDIQYVDWFEGDRFIVRAKLPPYGYNFTAPGNATSFTLKASATDLSGNSSDLAVASWSVVANAAPADVSVVAMPASVFLARHIDATVTFKDEGLTATTSLRVIGSHQDGTPYELPASRIKPSVNQQVTRTAVDAAWPAVSYGIDLPGDLKEGEPLRISATVTDSVNQSTTGSAAVALAVDAIAPRIVSLTPAAETHYLFGTTYHIAVQATDAESGVARVSIAYDGKTINLTTAVNNVYAADVAVTAKNADTRIHIVASAFDFHGNRTDAATDVIYDSVNDGTFPVAQWLTPLDRAALPAGQTLPVKLRVHATDDRHVESVRFDSLALATPVAPVLTPSAGDIYEAIATVTVPASGSFAITATIADADPAHEVTLPIAIDAIAIDQQIVADAAITSSNIAQYANKSVLVTGSATTLFVTVPLTARDLIVIGGAKVSNPDRTKLDLTVTGSTYVDGDSAINLTAKGLLGGWARSDDGATTNSSARGAAGFGDGALNASASHAGLAGGTTNGVYGSVLAPAAFGSGGSGAPTCCDAGANGGGAIALRGGQMTLAGAVRADGGSGFGRRYAGSGGSVLIAADALVTGPATRITANGGDEDEAPNGDAGGGGGRVALSATSRFDVFSVASEIQARGGRNGGVNEGVAYLDGGAGTIVVTRPGKATAALIVSSLDDRYPASTHQTRGSPLSGTLIFDSITIGPRALARFDDDFSASTVAVDPTATLLRKTDQPSLTVIATTTSVIQDSSLAATYAAASPAGVGDITFTIALASKSVSFASYPKDVATTATSVLVPFDAAVAAATDLTGLLTDRAGRTAQSKVSGIAIVANTPPAIDRVDVVPPQTYAGHTLAVAVTASDDVKVKTLSLTTTVGTVATTTPSTFVVAIPATTAGGTSASLTVSASDGFPGRAATTKVVLVPILADTNPPVVTVTSPIAGTTFDVSSAVRIPIRATVVDNEVGVASVWATIDGGPRIPMTPDPSTVNRWAVDAAVPSVDGSQPVPKSIVVHADDFVPNTGHSAPLSINVRPVFDQNGPVVSWLCPTSGAMFPAGYATQLRVSAVPSPLSPDNGVTSVVFFVGDDINPIAAASAGGGVYQASLTVPAATAPIVLKVVATSIRGNVTTVQQTISIVTGTTISTDTPIITGDTRYDGQTLIITGGKVTIDGPHTIANLVILNGSIVTHTAVNPAGLGALEISVTGATYIGCGGSIDVTGKGYQDAANGSGRTWPNTTTGGSFQTSAGSHGGEGGGAGERVASPFGSLFDPNEPGGAGGHGGNYVGNAGGGIARIKSTLLVVDGAIAADGVYAGQGGSGAGAGGSIRIDAATSGAGTIHADGAAPVNFNNGGGGGRVAIYGTTTMTRSQITAHGGSGAPNAGAPGTVFMKAPSQNFGSLFVDNGARVTSALTTLTSVAPGPRVPVVTAVTADSVRDASASFAAPNVLIGIRLILNNDATKQWPIVANDDKLIRISPDAAFQPRTGDSIRGLYRFDSIALINAHLEVADLITSGIAVQKDAVSTFISGNSSPPSISRSLISIRASSVGSVVVGTAGAVSDTDTPISILTTNTRTGVTYSSLADRVDGHFIASVAGNTGDVVTVRARDGHRFPLESEAVTLDPLTSSTPSTSQFSSASWGVDPGFLSRSIAVGGRAIAVAGYPMGDTGASENLALLDATDATHPTFKRIVRAGRGAIRDISISGDWAYVVSDRFSTLNVKDPAAQPNFTSDRCGRENAVAVSGTFAFTAETDCANSARIIVYDVANPAAPRYLNEMDLAPGSGTTFTDLLTYGADYVVGVSASASGRDLTVIDRRDVDALKIVANLAIPNFAAFRGTIAGRYVYLTSLTSTDLVIVDLGNPSAPLIAARTTLPRFGGNVAVASGAAYIASSAAGIAVVSADPSSASVTGSVPVDGNAFDLALGVNAIYVADESGIAVVPLALPPLVDVTRIVVTTASSTSATVAGAAEAVLGVAPLSVDTNGTTNSVASNGSFTATISAVAGDAVAVKATDKDARSLGPVPIGSVAFGSAVTRVPIAVADAGDIFRARTLASEGSLLAAVDWANDGSDRIALFDISNPAAPILKRAVSGGSQVLYDVKIANGWAYIASFDFCTLNLLDPSSTKNCFSPRSVLSVAPAGKYAFTSGGGQFVRVYDVTNPAAALFLREQAVGASLYGLVAYGSDYLIGTSPVAGTDGLQHDIVVFDRRDLNNLIKVADLDIPNFDAFRGRIVGSTMIVAGLGGRVAVIDLTNPRSPVVKSVVTTGGVTHGVAGAGNVVVAADSSRGVTFLDTSSTPRIVGTQAVGGNAWDVLLTSGVMYVATGTGIAVVSDVAAPPLVQTSLITITADGTGIARVVGQARAVDGKAPLTLEVRDVATGALAGVAVSADGSFIASIPAGYNDALTLKIIDGAGRSTGPLDIGTVQPPALAINTARITLSHNGANAVATGLAAAITGGQPPLSAILTNATSAASAPGIAVAADGSFVGSVAASTGNVITLRVADAGGRSIGPLSLGLVPVALTLSTTHFVLDNDGGAVSVAGDTLAVSGSNPITLRFTNARTSVVTTATVQSGVTFTTALAGAAPGDAITVAAADATGSAAGPLSLGAVPPAVAINATLIRVGVGGSVAGTTGAVVGRAPLVLTLQPGTVFVTIAADGSFKAIVNAAAGTSITGSARDGGGHVTPTATLGVYVDAASLTITPAMTGNDANFRARTLAVDGNVLAVCSYREPVAGGVVSGGVGASSKVLLFDISDPANPNYVRTIDAESAVVDVKIANGWLFMATEGSLRTSNLGDLTGAVYRGAGTRADSVAIIGNHAYTVTGNKLTTWDITQPAAPVNIELRTFPASALYRTLIPYAGRYIVAISSNEQNSSTTLSIFDTELLGTVAYMARGAFIPVRGRVVGTTLVLSTTTGGAMTIDLSDLQLPAVISTTTGVSSSASYGLDVFGPTAFVANGTSGLAMVDVQDPVAPLSVDVRSIGSSAWDVRSIDGTLIVAADTSLYTSAPSAGAPFIDPSRISVTARPRAGSTQADVSVAGASGAVRGKAPLTVDVKYGTSSAFPAQVTSGGGFSTQFVAAVGDFITATARDAQSRTSATLRLGQVPYGTQTAIPGSIVDAAFRARQFALDGDTLVVTSRIDADGSGGSDKVVLFDVSAPATPVYRSTLSIGHGAILGIAVDHGWLYVVSQKTLSTIDLHAATPIIHSAADALPDGPCAVGVLGTYAFTSCSSSVWIFDVADPANPIFFQGAGLPGSTTLYPWDSFHFISTDPSGFYGTVNAADPRHPGWNPGFGLTDRAARIGDRFLVTDPRNRLVREVPFSFSNDYLMPSASVPTAGACRGIDVAGTTAIVADGAAGVSLFDFSTPGTPSRTATYPTGTPAWDVKVTRNTVYAANETGIQVLSGLALPPVIHERFVNAATDGLAVATITGQATSVTGQPPLTVDLKFGAASTLAVPVSSAGSFGPAAVSAPPGASVMIQAADASARKATATVPVPFAAAVDTFTLKASLTNDRAATLRRLALDGSKLFATCGFPWNESGESDAIFVFDATRPIATQTPSILHAPSSVQAIAASNGWLYLATESGFATLNTATGQTYTVSGHTAYTYAVAVSGNYAFVSSDSTAGIVLQIYDVANPAAPVFIREEQQFEPGGDVWGIKTIGANYLAIFQPYSNGAAGDVVIVDRRDINHLTVVASVPVLDATDAAVTNNTLFVYGYSDGITLVDITNPAAPAVLSTVVTPGLAIGIAVSGTNEIAVADGLTGVTFIDVSDRTHPVVKGSQQVTGAPSDVITIGKTVFTAAEGALVALKRP